MFHKSLSPLHIFIYEHHSIGIWKTQTVKYFELAPYFLLVNFLSSATKIREPEGLTQTSPKNAFVLFFIEIIKIQRLICLSHSTHFSFKLYSWLYCWGVPYTQLTVQHRSSSEVYQTYTKFLCVSHIKVHFTAGKLPFLGSDLELESHVLCWKALLSFMLTSEELFGC